MSSESVSNLSDTDANKKIKRELRLRDRVLVRGFTLSKRAVFQLDRDLLDIVVTQAKS